MAITNQERAGEALACNALVQSWPEIMRLARESAATAEAQPAQVALDL